MPSVTMQLDHETNLKPTSIISLIMNSVQRLHRGCNSEHNWRLQRTLHRYPSLRQREFEL